MPSSQEKYFFLQASRHVMCVYLSDDSKAEANEDVTIKLVSVVSGLVDIGTPGTITIRDNEPVAYVF